MRSDFFNTAFADHVFVIVGGSCKHVNAHVMGYAIGSHIIKPAK